MKHAKVKQGMVPSLCLALTILFVAMAAAFVPGEPKAASREREAATLREPEATLPREYAVQIAAVRSQQIADDMRSGLMVQGLEAYWVRTELPEHGLFYRVRLGKFPSLETAYTFAEVLLNTGLLESYAITAYEKPMSVPLRDMTQASIEVQEYVHQGPSSRESSELFAALGAKQWLLPPNRNLFATIPATSQVAPQVMGMNRRDQLVYALSNRQWRMTPDPSIFFVRAPMVQPTAIAVSNTPPVSNIGATSNPLPNANMGAAVNPVSPRIETATAIPPVASAVSSQPSLTPPPPPTGVTSAPNRSFAADRNAAAEIGRGSKPTASRAINSGAKNMGQARLQATAELRNGQLVMKIRNLDADRSFSGTARVTLSDDKNSNEVSPLKFDLGPEGEVVLPINDPVNAGSSWMLMVFDEGNAMRLLRGASLGQRPVVAAQQGSPNPSDPAAVGAPPYVTGVYDATGAPGGPGTMPQGNAPVGVALSNEPAAQMNGAAGQNAAGASSNATPNSVTGADAPAQLTITPRQIAVTTENVTLEFDIASPQPLNYISVTLAAGDYRDVRQALMSTTRGRVPFLIPAAQAAGTFIYEIKDEGGRTLGGGVGDFRQLGGR